MPEIWFYHLERQSLDQALPALLEKTLERGWRAVVQAGSSERLEAIDSLLWTYRDASFLAHGTKRDGNEARHPIYLTTDDTNPNRANIRFLVEGAVLEIPDGSAIDAYERVVYLFDGADEQALKLAREAWRNIKQTPHEATYWRQTETGAWQKQQ